MQLVFKCGRGPYGLDFTSEFLAVTSLERPPNMYRGQSLTPGPLHITMIVILDKELILLEGTLLCVVGEHW